MSYRDDRDADQARIAALEAELARAQQTIAELEGRGHTALARAAGATALARATPTPSTAARWLGAPIRLELSRRFDGAYPVDQFEQLIERIREETREPGRSELLRSSLTWSSGSSDRGVGPFLLVMVAVKARPDEPGHTTLTVTDRLGQLAGALFGGLGGGVGGGGIAVPISASIAVPALAPVFVLGWLGGVFGLTRAIYRRAARRRAERLQRVFDALVAEIDAELAR